MVLDSDEACLIVRQNPKQALGTPEHKEKCKPTLDAISFELTTCSFPTARKPVDPPPIVQLKVEGRDVDAHRCVQPRHDQGRVGEEANWSPATGL